jgi:dTDP-4-dehydrorhamnose reductase
VRILITGGDGQLGRALQRALRHEDVVPLPRASLDVSDAGAVLAALRDVAPAIVVHCAALTDTVRCEREPEVAEAVNAVGTGNVARVCAQQDRWLIVVSTNEVFDGSATAPYQEDAATAPVNAYGRSKLRGEGLATAMQADTVIVRTSWLYGEGEQHFVGKVLAAAKGGQPLRFVTDEIANPTLCDDLADGIRGLIDRNAGPGVYHLVNEGVASRYEWARAILDEAGIDVPLAPVTTAELRAEGYAGPVKPAYSALANTRAAAIGVRLRPWRDALAANFSEIRVKRDG